MLRCLVLPLMLLAALAATEPDVSEALSGWSQPAGRAAPASASGHRPQVEALVGNRLHLQGWRGTAADGSTGSCPISLQWTNTKTGLWLAIDAVSVQSARSAPWHYGPLRAMDTRLQWAWIAGRGVAQSGTGDGSFPSDAVVLELWCRHEVGGGDGFTAPNSGDFSAVVAVPAGMRLGEARKQPELVLARLPMLKEFRPGPDSPALRFEVGPGGAWRLALDLGRDGEADIVFGHTSPDCRPHALPGLNGERSLWVSLIPSGGIRSGQVGLSSMVLWQRADPQALPSEDRQRRPLRVSIPDRSPISPWRGTVRRWRPHLELSASPNLRLTQVDPLTFLAEADLNPGAPTTLMIAQQGEPPTRHEVPLAWQSLDPARDELPTQLLRGDAVLISAATAVSVRAPNGSTQTIPARARQALTFSDSGSWDVTAGARTQSVLVTDTDLPAILPATTSGRLLAVRTAPGLNAQRLSVQAAAGLQATWIEGGDDRVALLQLRGKPGDHHLHLLHDNSPVATSSVRIFTLELTGGGGGGAVINHDEPVIHFRAKMEPYVPGVPIRFTTIDRACSFHGGALAFTVVSGGGPADNGEAPMREVDGIGLFDYRMRVPGGGWAHRFDAALDNLDLARRPTRRAEAAPTPTPMPTPVRPAAPATPAPPEADRF